MGIPSHVSAPSAAGSNVGCRVYNSANISIASATETYLTFDTEDYDNGGLHSTATNTGRITVTSAGVYLFWANVDWASNVNGIREIDFRINGAGSFFGSDQGFPGTGGTYRQQVTALLNLAANDYVEVGVYQDSGGALNVQKAGRVSPEFGCQKIDKGG